MIIVVESEWNSILLYFLFYVDFHHEESCVLSFALSSVCKQLGELRTNHVEGVMLSPKKVIRQ